MPKDKTAANFPLSTVDTKQFLFSSSIAALTAIVTLSFSGCSPIGPNHETPNIPLPDQWNTSLRSDLNSSTPDIAGWWRKFNDPKLNQVIGTARNENRTLAITAERIKEAQALIGVTKGGMQPMVGATGHITKDRVSENVLPLPGPVPGNPFNFYSAGTAATWELDFVGGIRRTVEAAKANKEATEEFHRDAMIIVFAEAASAYVDCRTLSERIKIAKANIALQRESLRISRERNKIGLSPDLDVSLAETNLARSESLVPVLRSLLSASQNRLGVLCGKYPGTIDAMLGSGAIPRPPRSASVGIPANIVRSRPDIRSAERALAAQTALVGVAQAELYPKFTLSGVLALQSGSSSSFADSESKAYSFGPGFRWRIFEGGRIRETIKLEQSKTKQAYYNYERVVIKAMAEVETAMSAIANERDRQASLKKSVAAAKRSVSQVRDNYLAGLIGFETVLEADRSLFLMEDALTVSQGQLARNHIALYRAIGGGSEMPSPKGGLKK